MTHVHEDIGAYVLGALDEESARRVAQHLKECPGRKPAAVAWALLLPPTC